MLTSILSGCGGGVQSLLPVSSLVLSEARVAYILYIHCRRSSNSSLVTCSRKMGLPWCVPSGCWFPADGRANISLKMGDFWIRSPQWTLYKVLSTFMMVSMGALSSMILYLTLRNVTPSSCQCIADGVHSLCSAMDETLCGQLRPAVGIG
jgi:hypothetical protein